MIAGLFRGGFEENGVSLTVFCGQLVVDRMANVDNGLRVFED